MMNRSRRILVVDDEAQIVRVLRRGLAARGYEAVVASEGEEPLESINSWAPDLVITIQRQNKAHRGHELLSSGRAGDYVDHRMAIADLRILHVREPHKTTASDTSQASLNSFR